MAGIVERRWSKSARWSHNFGWFSLVLALVAGIGHRQGLVETVAFLWVLALVALLAAVALILAAVAFPRIWYRGDLGGRSLFAGVLTALIVLAPFGLLLYRGYVDPMLSDISTDTEDPPALVAAQALRDPQMNAIARPTPGQARLQLDAYPEVTGRRYDMPFDRVVDIVSTMVARRGWTLTGPEPAAADQTEVTIEALARTLVLRLPVDVSIRITDEETSTYVDMRSASRYGRHDFGDNAARIAGFLDELDGEVASQAGAAPPD